MKYIIMCAGSGTRWNNYLGVKKQMIEIEGETLLDRTIRLIGKENDITVVSNDFNIKGVKNYRPTLIGCEIDRFLGNSELWLDEDVIFIYGDVYYTENAMNLIKKDKSKTFRYFGRSSGGKHAELFAIKLNSKYTHQFYNICMTMREEMMNGRIGNTIGWHTYLEMIGETFKMSWDSLREYLAKDELKHFTEINDETDDFDEPLDYEVFNKKIVFYFHKLWLGGSFKATYALIQKLYKTHNIVVVYKITERPDLIKMLEQYIPVIKVKNNYIYCDTLINVTLQPPSPNMIYRKGISWVHSALKDLNITTHLFEDRIVVSKHGATHVDNAKIIYNEIDENIHSLANEYTIPKFDGLKLVMVCRLSREKGFDNVLNIIKDIKQPFKLYIVGSTEHIRYEILLRDMFKNYPQVEFVGEQLNPYPYIKWADYLLVTSTRETWNLTITEAFALKTPIIATYFPALTEQLIDGENGYLYTEDVWDKPIPKPEYEYKKHYLNWGLDNNLNSKQVKLIATEEFKDILTDIYRNENEIFTVEYIRYLDLLNKEAPINELKKEY